MKHLFTLLCCAAVTVSAQSISWTDVSASYSLPAGVKLFSGSRTSPALAAWYLDVDMKNQTIAVRPYLAATPANVATLTAQFGAIASINGGVFSGSQSLASVVYPFEIKAQNVAAVNRTSQSYPVLRSFFGITNNREMRIDWIYHFDASLAGLYSFTAPLPYILNDPSPKAVPLSSQGSVYQNLLVGIGGVPTLVKAGQVRITFNEEIVWGSGIATDTTASDPRTAVGWTAQKHCILFVADGRGANGSSGLGLGELARILINLGCVEAMNLDGGGSTQMAVGGSTVNGQSSRAVPTILSVVVADSMNLPKTPKFEKIIDNGDPECSFWGAGWFESANPGYYGTTRSKLNPTGDGSSYAVFRATLPRPTVYTLFAWWVAASNRCTQTPFVITHNHTRDTVLVDQSANGSQWVPIGTYQFAGDGTDSVVITNKSSIASAYVVADAIRFVSYDLAFTGIAREASPPSVFRLEQNYPNPFNPSTTIRFSVSTRSQTRLTIFNLLGQQVAELASEEMSAGSREITWNATVATGLYFYRLEAVSVTDPAHRFVDVKKMILLK
jgi:hypothetical protein